MNDDGAASADVVVLSQEAVVHCSDCNGCGERGSLCSSGLCHLSWLWDRGLLVQSGEAATRSSHEVSICRSGQAEVAMHTVDR